MQSRSDHGAGELIPQGSPQPRRDGSGCTNTPAASLLCGTTRTPPHSLPEVLSGIAPCIGFLPFLSHSPTLPPELSVITDHRIDYLNSYSVSESATGEPRQCFSFYYEFRAGNPCWDSVHLRQPDPFNTRRAFSPSCTAVIPRVLGNDHRGVPCAALLLFRWW